VPLLSVAVGAGSMHLLMMRGAVAAHGTSRDGIVRRANEKVRGGTGYGRATTRDPPVAIQEQSLLSGRLLCRESDRVKEVANRCGLSHGAGHVNAPVVERGLFVPRQGYILSLLTSRCLAGPSALFLTGFWTHGTALVHRRRDTPEGARGTSLKCACGWRGSPWPQL